MKYKLRSYKRETIMMVALLILFICYITALLLAFPVQSSDPKIVYVKETIEEKLGFSGVKKSEITFNKMYANYVYDNNGKIESHFVDLKEKKEVLLDDFVKSEMKTAFYAKIYELLQTKYPSYIAQILNESAAKTITFTIDKLKIQYEDVEQKIDIKDNYFLDVKYSVINPYLKFNINIKDEQDNENQTNNFVYDKNKISVAFSFDDGPNGDKTITLVNELEKRNMSATFFMVGYKLNNDIEAVKHVHNSHSEIGYHSWNHTDFKKQSKEKIIEEFNKTDNIINEITGGHLYLTRPPYGSYNKTTLEALQTPLIRWNLDTNDWRYRDVEHIKKYVLENISDGSIILFHDTYDTTIEAAVWLMEELKNRDIQVMNVTELARLKDIQLSGHNVYYSFKK